MWRIDNDKTLKQVKNIHQKTQIDEVDEQVTETESVNPPEEKENDYWYYIKMPLIDVNFDNLISKNSDTVAWIKLNGTNINYPVVQTSDNKYYLTHSFDKTYNEAGWVFLDYRNNLNELSQNNIIYGHSRLDKTMFGSLKNITKSDWYKNKDNYVVHLSTPTKNTLWQVFSVYRIPTESYYITTKFSSDSEFQRFIDTITNRSIYKFGVTLNTNDKILTLSTCADGDKKVVMHAKLIKQSLK